MGTKKLKSEYTEYFVLPKTKNTVFSYKTQFDTIFTYAAKLKSGYETPITYCTVNKNNLVIITKYFNKSKGKFKTIKTTFKNYFLSEYYNDIIYNRDYNENGSPNFQQFTIETLCKNKKGIISDEPSSEINSLNFILGSKKKDTYTLSYGMGDFIYDEKGNDTYNLLNNYSGEIYDCIYDFSGKDNYVISNYTKAKIFEYSGNDIYSAGVYSLFNITDYSGNDKYNLIDSKGEIVDYKGKDTYTISNSSVDIFDYKGKDKYILNDNLSKNTVSSDNRVNIYDKEGNETYEITDFSNLNIYDYKGKDTYTVKDSKTVEIEDYSGSDTYKIFNSNILKDDGTNGNIYDYLGKDYYEISNSKNFVISDESGNDEFKINGLSNNIEIKSLKGKNKYNFEDSSDIKVSDYDLTADTTYILDKIDNSFDPETYSISDFGGADKYNVSKSKGIFINDSGVDSDTYTITDSSDFKIKDYGYSKDIYNISASAGKIEDNFGGDIYNISNLSKVVEVNDNFGSDTINFTDCKASNLVFMSQINANGLISGDLIIYDSNNKGYVLVDNFFEIDATAKNYTAISTQHKIEKIFAGKDDISNYTENWTSFNLVKENIIRWLDKEGKASVVDVLNSKEPDDIEAIIVRFGGKTV